MMAKQQLGSSLLRVARSQVGSISALTSAQSTSATTSTSATICHRFFSSLSSSPISGNSTSGTSTTAATDTPYTSPFAEFFEQVKTNTFPYADLDFPHAEKTFLQCGIPEDALRFRTECYGRLQLAPHVQPWEHRVTVRVAMKDIPLVETTLEHDLFREIVGSRLKNGVLKLSSNQFGSRIENKRHLVTMLDRIVLGAKRLAKEMEDSSAAVSGEEHVNYVPDDSKSDEDNNVDIDTDTYTTAKEHSSTDADAPSTSMEKDQEEGKL